MDHLNGQNYTAHSVRFSEMEQNSQKISAHEQLSKVCKPMLEYILCTVGIEVHTNSRYLHTISKKDHIKNQVNTALKDGTRLFFLIVLSVV